MAAPVPLRSDCDAQALRVLAQGSHNPAQTRRLLALSVISAGGSRSEAAEIGGVGLQTVRDWVLAFNADGPDGLIDGKAPGARPRLNPDQCDALKHGNDKAHPPGPPHRITAATPGKHQESP